MMSSNTQVHPTAPPLPPSSAGDNPPPPPRTHVVLFPKEQILRYPPPENAKKIETLTRRKTRRSCCRRCCCYSLCILLLLVVSAAISAGVLYLVFRFRSPNYTVTDLTITGLNATSSAPISPNFNVTVRADNPNGKIGIYYLRNGAITVSYDGVKLSDGVLPVFYQPRRNLTVIETALSGSDVVLGRNVRAGLRSAVSEGRVAFVVRIRAPVKIRVGSVNTWEIRVRVKCDVVVDGLNRTATIVSRDCDYSVRLW